MELLYRKLEKDFDKEDYEGKLYLKIVYMQRG